jgi:ketosteroid isomerase-like protein
VNTRKEIELLTQNFAEAVTARDLDTMVSYYEESARFLPPGAAMAEGRTAIRAAQQRMLDAGVQALELEALDIIDAGDFSIEIGRTTVTIQPPGSSSAITNHGKSVVVWHRQADGTLKIVLDILNSDSEPRRPTS